MKGRGLRSRRLTWIGLAVLLIATVVLAGYAALGRGAPRATGTPIPIDSFAPAPTYSPIPTATAAPEPLALPVQSRLVAGVNAKTAYRTSTVACPASADAVIQTTTDGGKTWTDHKITGAAGLRSISPYTDTKIIAGTVALPGCTLDTWRSFTAGVSWTSQPSARADAVVVDPKNPATIQREAGPVASSCTGIAAGALASGGGMAVVCTDAKLYVSPADHPAAWSAPVLPGAAVGVAPLGTGYLVAVRRDADCPGLALISLATRGGVHPLACLTTLVDEKAPVALGTSIDGTPWLWVGGSIGSSADGGTTWNGFS